MRTCAALVACLVIGVVLLGLPSRAAAQDRPVDVAGGYMYSRITNGEGTNLPAGWFGAVGVGIGGTLGIVGEVNGAYKTQSETAFGTTIDVKLSLHSFLAGLRVRSPRGRARGFGQVLFGGHRSAASISLSGVPVPDGVDEDVNETNFAIAPGGGVDIALSGRTGIRLGANFQLVQSEDEWGKVFQAQFGFFWSR